MKMKMMILLLILHLAWPIAGAAPEPTCQDTCGNVSIHYPFGIGRGCYLDEDFSVTCKRDSKGILTPYLDGQTSLELLSISINDPYLRIRTEVASDCYSNYTTDGNFTSDPEPLNLQSPKFPFSTTRNKFTAVGCDTTALMSSQVYTSANKDYNFSLMDRRYTGCLSICFNESAVPDDGTCKGVGCCQTPEIPQGLTDINISISSFFNHFFVHEFNPCSYAFLVDSEFYHFKGFKDIDPQTVVPTVLDWAVGSTNCSAAEKNSTSFACKVNSVCYDSASGPGYGYICNCTKGYKGNPYIGCKDINECTEDPNLNMCKGKCINTEGSFTCIDDNHTIAFICASIGLISMVVVVFMLYIYARKRQMKKRRESCFRQNGGLLLEDNLTQRGDSINAIKIFSSEDLEKATDNFSEDNIVGHGGFGTVYRGCLSDGRIVAVKKSKMVDQNQIGQFINEVTVLSQINHRNVVRFLGCCLETSVPLLVYEFITNGTLYDHIHNENDEHIMPWDIRLKVATESAGVLAYLHSAHSTPIIHRDIKPTNILLDENYTAKVSDFGTSKLVPQSETQLCTMVQGTLGYLDPEYLHSSELTEKSDVYSFGVVLLELLTGRKAISFARAEEERSLVKYFVMMMKDGRMLNIFDERIISEENLEQMIEVAKIANSCLRVKGDERPTMKEVLKELEGLKRILHHKSENDDRNMEESQYLLGETFVPCDATNGSTTTSYSNTGDHIMLMPLDDGR